MNTAVTSVQVPAPKYFGMPMPDGLKFRDDRSQKGAKRKENSQRIFLINLPMLDAFLNYVHV